MDEIKDIKKLQPSTVWKYFDEILKIPRPSKKEEKIAEYIVDFSKKHGLECKRDEIGNVLVKKAASSGFENRKTVILQSHMDMVCEKNADVKHNFDNDPIKAIVTKENGIQWVKAIGTTLGADDGIGIAAQLAILASEEIKHGPIECLFTVDEETGLTGAFGLKEGFMNGDILLNLDSEDEGELFIGCAGGKDTVGMLSMKTCAVPSNSVAFRVDVSGLKGGHSGDDIHKGLGNSNKILNRFLWNTERLFHVRLSNFDGGNLRNAIAREAFAIVTLKAKKKELFLDHFQNFRNQIKQEFAKPDENLELKIKEVELPEHVFKKSSQRRLMNLIYSCPHGVVGWSQDVEGLVETSTNLASVKIIGNVLVEIVTSQRSSVESCKDDITSMMESVFRLAGASVEHSHGYPGWQPNTNSEILKITEMSYKKLFGKDPVVRAIHAGLECGLFLEKYPDLDMISFGPTIKGAHSPDERLDVETTQKFWDLLLDVLDNTPEKA